jgi:hypothetical protein
MYAQVELLSGVRVGRKSRKAIDRTVRALGVGAQAFTQN